MPPVVKMILRLTRHLSVKCFLRCDIYNKCGRVAQLAEQCPFKAWVNGSSPSALTRYPSRIIGLAPSKLFPSRDSDPHPTHSLQTSVPEHRA